MPCVCSTPPPAPCRPTTGRRAGGLLPCVRAPLPVAIAKSPVCYQKPANSPTATQSNLRCARAPGSGAAEAAPARARPPTTPPPAAAAAAAPSAGTPRAASDLLLPDGDDLLGMTAHTPGDGGSGRGGFGGGRRGGGGGMDAGEMGRMVERIVAAAGSASGGGGSAMGSNDDAQSAPPISPPSRRVWLPPHSPYGLPDVVRPWAGFLKGRLLPGTEDAA